MKAFELCICAIACISLTSCMTITENLSQSYDQQAKRFVNDCLIEAGMTREDGWNLEDIYNNVFKQPGMEEKRQKHGCAIECILRKMKWMEGSQVKEEKLYSDMAVVFADDPSKATVEELMRNCVAKVKNATQERCEKGVAAMLCGIDVAQNLNLVPTDQTDEEHEIN